MPELWSQASHICMLLLQLYLQLQLPLGVVEVGDVDGGTVSLPPEVGGVGGPLAG